MLPIQPQDCVGLTAFLKDVVMVLLILVKIAILEIFLFPILPEAPTPQTAADAIVAFHDASTGLLMMPTESNVSRTLPNIPQALIPVIKIANFIVETAGSINYVVKRATMEPSSTPTLSTLTVALIVK